MEKAIVDIYRFDFADVITTSSMGVEDGDDGGSDGSGGDIVWNKEIDINN